MSLTSLEDLMGTIRKQIKSFLEISRIWEPMTSRWEILATQRMQHPIINQMCRSFLTCKNPSRIILRVVPIVQDILTTFHLRVTEQTPMVLSTLKKCHTKSHQIIKNFRSLSYKSRKLDKRIWPISSNSFLKATNKVPMTHFLRENNTQTTTNFNSTLRIWNCKREGGRRSTRERHNTRLR